jgi:hypothetical protein
MRSVTFRGASVVGGRERGGLDMFCEEVISSVRFLVQERVKYLQVRI